ncbi:ABC transporter permease [Candidatus Atribacteria bacterium MT.SAG.1]|nr:ABC transporter permease [Candidatus Atribacteria bacterium MT.SAG.1]
MISDIKQKGEKLLRILEVKEIVLFGVILIFWIVMGFVAVSFKNPSNIKAIFLGLSTEAIIAIGMANLLISGGLDLSVGATLALGGVVSSLCMKAGLPVPISIIIGILTGSIIGFTNGTIVERWRINPLIVTLGMQTVVRGFTLILAGGTAIVGLPESFALIGKGKIFGIQYPIIITIVLVIVGDILVRRSRFFRQNFYVGGNEKAALMTGINVKKIKIFNYVLTSTLAALAGVLIAARLAAASVNIGVGIELRVIAACVIGGASLSGGEGSIVGAFFGTLLMATIVNSLNLLGVDVYWQNIVSGIILIGAVVLDTVMRKRRELKSK